MIDFNALSKANKYADENIDEYLKTIIRIGDSDNWTDFEKQIFREGVYNGLIHGYYNAIREHKGEI